MGILKDLNETIVERDPYEQAIYEMDMSLDNAQLERIADHAVSEINKAEKDGGVTDPQEVISMAFEDMPEVTGSARVKYIKQIEGLIAKRLKK